MKSWAAIVALSLLILNGCGLVVPAKKMDKGTLVNGMYTNTYFDMTMTLPKDWYSPSDENNKALFKQGSKLVAGENKQMKAELDAADGNIVPMFTVFEKAPGAPVDFNPSIVSVAERVGHLPGIKDGKDYLFQAKKFLLQGQMKFKFVKDPYRVTVGGKPFDVMELELPIGAIVIKQKYYATVMGDYALSLIQSYVTEEQLKPLDESFGTMQFK